MNFSRALLYLSLSLTFGSSLFGQGWQEANRLPGGGFAAFQEPASLFLGQTFEDSVSLGGVTLVSAGGFDVYVARVSINGDLHWVRQIEGPGRDQLTGMDVDSDGNVYVTGFFEGTLDFGQSLLTSVGDFDIFLAKYSSDGDLLWATRAGGSGSDFPLAIALGEGSITITGEFGGTARFGATTLTSSGGQDPFVAVYSDAGNLIWAIQAHSLSYASGFQVSVDQRGDVLVSGVFGGSLSVIQRTFPLKVLTVHSKGQEDIFLVKLSRQSGIPGWITTIGGVGYEAPTEIKADAVGDVYLAGIYRDPISVGGQTLLSTGDFDFFLSKYHGGDGTLRWIHEGGGKGLDLINSIDTDTEGNVYVIGGYTEGARITSKSGTSFLQNLGMEDLFVASYAEDGTLRWVRTAGGDEIDTGGIIVALGLDELIVTGVTGTTVDFGCARNKVKGAFVARLSRHLPDLRIAALFALPGIHSPRGRLTIGTQLENVGVAAADVSIMRFVLAFGQGSRVLGSRGVGRLQPGESRLLFDTFTLPSDLAPGAFEVEATLDFTERICELEETNNVAIVESLHAEQRRECDFVACKIDNIGNFAVPGFGVPGFGPILLFEAYPGPNGCKADEKTEYVWYTRQPAGKGVWQGPRQVGGAKSFKVHGLSGEIEIRVDAVSGDFNCSASLRAFASRFPPIL